MEEIEVLLTRVTSGEEDAREALWRRVYPELHRLAQHRMARLRPGQTLQPTALVHEVFLRLCSRTDRDWDGAAHFYGAAARAMRNILVNAAQKRAHARRSDRTLAPEWLADPGSALTMENVLVVDEALDRLGTSQPRVAEVVLLRFFGGLTIPEVARALSISHATVERDWAFARAWLARELSP